MTTRNPVVRHFIACDEIESVTDKRQYSLINVIHTIQLLPGAAFPHIHPELFLFAMMTDAQGTYELSVELVYWDFGAQRSIWTSRRVKLDLGQDPLKIHGWPIRLGNLPFAQAGDYDFVLWCEGEIIARETIRVR